MRLAGLAALLALLAAGCAGGEGGERLTVFAAASLTDVFEQLDPEARFSFAGSDELAIQIREGARADVYAAASARHAAELHAEGLVDAPRVFATNRLALVVPRPDRAGIDSLDDLDRPDVRLVIGARGVPVGDYTRLLLTRVGRSDLLRRVVSEEEDAKGVLAKVRLGEADAGFVYATDARAAEGALRTVPLPAVDRVVVRYPVAIVSATQRRAEAERFVELLRSPRGRRILRNAGFGTP